MNAFAVFERLCGSFASKNVFRPFLNSDMCVCIPDPFSPNSGFGMKVA